PLWHALDDVEHHDIAQFLKPGQKGQRAADLAGADQCDLIACHGIFLCSGQGHYRPRVLARKPDRGNAQGSIPPVQIKRTSPSLLAAVHSFRSKEASGSPSRYVNSRYVAAYA